MDAEKSRFSHLLLAPLPPVLVYFLSFTLVFLPEESKFAFMEQNQGYSVNYLRHAKCRI